MSMNTNKYSDLLRVQSSDKRNKLNQINSRKELEERPLQQNIQISQNSHSLIQISNEKQPLGRYNLQEKKINQLINKKIDKENESIVSFNEKQQNKEIQLSPKSYVNQRIQQKLTEYSSKKDLNELIKYESIDKILNQNSEKSSVQNEKNQQHNVQNSVEQNQKGGYYVSKEYSNRLKVPSVRVFENEDKSVQNFNSISSIQYKFNNLGQDSLMENFKSLEQQRKSLLEKITNQDKNESEKKEFQVKQEKQKSTSRINSKQNKEILNQESKKTLKKQTIPGEKIDRNLSVNRSTRSQSFAPIKEQEQINQNKESFTRQNSNNKQQSFHLYKEKIKNPHNLSTNSRLEKSEFMQKSAAKQRNCESRNSCSKKKANPKQEMNQMLYLQLQKLIKVKKNCDQFMEQVVLGQILSSHEFRKQVRCFIKQELSDPFPSKIQ